MKFTQAQFDEFCRRLLAAQPTDEPDDPQEGFGAVAWCLVALLFWVVTGIILVCWFRPAWPLP